MIRIAVQSKGRLYEDTMTLLAEAGIKIPSSKRTLLVESPNFPVEILYLRDDDIPQSVATGVADLGIVGENEFVERGEDADVVRRLGFSKCRLSLAIPKAIDYPGVQWFEGKKIATSYPGILRAYLKEQGVCDHGFRGDQSWHRPLGRHLRYRQLRLHAREQQPARGRSGDEERGVADCQ